MLGSQLTGLARLSCNHEVDFFCGKPRKNNGTNKSAEISEKPNQPAHEIRPLDCKVKKIKKDPKKVGDITVTSKQN